MTDYRRPTSLDDAYLARRDHPGYTVLAGGTDLLVGSKHRQHPPGVIDIFGLEELCAINERSDGSLEIGAAATYAKILASDAVCRRLPILAAACSEIGALQIQARGTMGGNIANSSPVGDTLPVLLALDATIILGSTRGQREVAYERFCTGYRQTEMGDDELIVAIRFPAMPAHSRTLWRKIGTRRAQSISKVMIAIAANLDDGVLETLRIGLGAVAATPIRARQAESAALGKRPTMALADAVREALLEEIAPIDDVRSTAAYRSTVAGNIVRRFLMSLVAGE